MKITRIEHRHLILGALALVLLLIIPFNCERGTPAQNTTENSPFVLLRNEMESQAAPQELLQKETEYVKKMRDEMVTMQIERRGVQDSNVLRAMREVQRHLFVPQRLERSAYDDNPLPIGYGQTISQPYIVAFMTEMLKLNQNSNVLEIGTGSGYQAAVLAHITPHVFTIEIVKELGEAAADRFIELGYETIEVKVADGYHGWKEHAPFDAIIVTAAAEFIPPPLIKQLKDGGRMIIPVGGQAYAQELILVEKNGTDLSTKAVLPVRFVPFRRSW